jgi:hypothetical protein
VAAGTGDDDQSSGFLGRLFRLGGSSSSGGSTTPSGSQTSPLPYSGSYGNSLPPGGASMGANRSAPTGEFAAPSPTSLPTFGGAPETAPVAAANGPTERLTPRSRVSAAVTSADPVLTRFALGKSNDGSTFGMFMQIFADGTVVDSEGVHHVRPADLKPIFDAVQSGELYRLRGHCGAPSTDFIEYVHIVAYERRLGRLQAHSFSYSGNPQGCDHTIRHLHAAIENLQAKLSRQPVSASSATVGASSAPTVLSGSAPSNPSPIAPAMPGRPPAVPSTTGTGAVIPLTSAGPGH